MAAKGLIARGVPHLPGFFIYITGSIILLSIIVLALAAYAQSLSGNSSYYYDSGVSGFLLFAAIWTWLIHGGALAVEHLAPRFYYRIGVLVGYILSVIFWLTGWSWAASWAAYILSFDNYDSYDNIRGYWKAFGQTTAACAGLGALVWLLCIITLFIFCRACMRSSGSEPSSNTELVDPSKPKAPDNQTTSPTPQDYANQPVYGGKSSSPPLNP
ncbi:hypothetical protein F5Y19DRAFT_344773 [Xylariaceae sp. FL1651]|nr:hypothetical protein F5Y19DRAFT_344773 [Xylariaceae sp. FL1651]